MKRAAPKKINQRKVNGMTMNKFGYLFTRNALGHGTNLHRKIREFRPGQIAFLVVPIEGTKGRKLIPSGTCVRILSCYHVMDTVKGPLWIPQRKVTDPTNREIWGHSQHLRIQIRGQIFGRRQRKSVMQCVSGAELSRARITD